MSVAGASVVMCQCVDSERGLKCNKPSHPTDDRHDFVAMTEAELKPFTAAKLAVDHERLNKTYNAEMARLAAVEQAGLGMVGGDHYKKLVIDPWAVIKANHMGFFDGNALKYIMRYRHKDGLQDLKKARHYLEELIRQEEAREAVGAAFSWVGGFCSAAHHRDANDKQTTHARESDCTGWVASSVSVVKGLCSAPHGRYGDGYVEHVRTPECINWTVTGA